MLIETVFADKKGRIYNFPGLRACGMKAGRFEPLDPKELLKLPSKSELFMLPDRAPVGMDKGTGEPVVLEADPYAKSPEPVYSVAAFIPPGYTLTHNTAYKENPSARLLPLFAYAPCAYYKGDFYISAIHTDRGRRHDERTMDPAAIRHGISHYKKLFPKNRLVPHLANCATVNACANAKNFFLGRFEAPIPSSPSCNAQCQGCISFQPAGRVPPTQVRISFTPTPEEIAEIALYHIDRAPDSLVSFGQGCEGEPSLSGPAIEKSIRLIRQKTRKGRINMNTNASLPKTTARLFEAGLDQIRVSLNSVREPYYSRYYQPKGYSLKEVLESVRIAKNAGGFVSINYLSMPGFTDSAGETEALKKFIQAYGIDMIQWRNLNYDPLQYFRDLQVPSKERSVGMGAWVRQLKKLFPRLKMGYFNPRGARLIRKAVHAALLLCLLASPVQAEPRPDVSGLEWLQLSIGERMDQVLVSMYALQKSGIVMTQTQNDYYKVVEAELKSTPRLYPVNVSAIMAGAVLREQARLSEEELLRPMATRTLHKTREASSHYIRLKGSEKPHMHHRSHLAVWVLRGRVELHLQKRILHLIPGDTIQIPRGAVHWAKSISKEPSEVYAIYTPAYDGSDYHPTEEEVPGEIQLEP